MLRANLPGRTNTEEVTPPNRPCSALSIPSERLDSGQLDSDPAEVDRGEGATTRTCAEQAGTVHATPRRSMGRLLEELRNLCVLRVAPNPPLSDLRSGSASFGVGNFGGATGFARTGPEVRRGVAQHLAEGLASQSSDLEETWARRHVMPPCRLFVSNGAGGSDFGPNPSPARPYPAKLVGLPSDFPCVRPTLPTGPQQRFPASGPADVLNEIRHNTRQRPQHRRRSRSAPTSPTPQGCRPSAGPPSRGRRS